MRNRGERTVAQEADDLGVTGNQLHRWAAQYEQQAVAKRNENGEIVEDEVRRLRKENACSVDIEMPPPMTRGHSDRGVTGK